MIDDTFDHSDNGGPYLHHTPIRLIIPTTKKLGKNALYAVLCGLDASFLSM
ncbi:hypothetical protein FD20_GL000097 [Liquorilactobacillus uvarum DSM 19971]|uniref:Uncharacterized protein n=1 Tax=Liquorilactobacillus uvarum DSM 19971 TaxID=1423812 RepID=A0A0R1Q312_9LACO|nr:hypothetical protein FD20_GL000097 [Liquorilactobacillus uvarum DSM 19971]